MQERSEITIDIDISDHMAYHAHSIHSLNNINNHLHTHTLTPSSILSIDLAQLFLLTQSTRVFIVITSSRSVSTSSEWRRWCTALCLLRVGC